LVGVQTLVWTSKINFGLLKPEIRSKSNKLPIYNPTLVVILFIKNSFDVKIVQDKSWTPLNNDYLQNYCMFSHFSEKE